MVSSALENQFITPNNMVIFSCTMISWRKRLLYIDWNNWAHLPPPSGCASLGLGQECSKSRNKDVDTKDVVCLPFISHHFLRRMNMCFISCLLVGSFFLRSKFSQTVLDMNPQMASNHTWGLNFVGSKRRKSIALNPFLDDRENLLYFHAFLWSLINILWHFLAFGIYF